MRRRRSYSRGAAAEQCKRIRPGAAGGEFPGPCGCVLLVPAGAFQQWQQQQQQQHQQQGDEFHCHLCNLTCNTAQQLQCHTQGKQHIKKLRRRGLAVPQADASELPASGGGSGGGEASDNSWLQSLADGQLLCRVCGVRLQAASVQSHAAGRSHAKAAAAASVLPELPLSPARLPTPEQLLEAPPATGLRPRGYQLELYEQCFLGNGLCYLPTGAGKTLVAVLAMLKLLSLNPLHQAVFVVDKSLLVLQQGAFVEEQAAGAEMVRFVRCPDKRLLTERRRLAVASVCGEWRRLPDALPASLADIVVTTAAYFENRLADGGLRLRHCCLVVLDEAHHCSKMHPFAHIVQRLRSCAALTPPTAPLLLGLTASPAGRSSLRGTVDALASLLSNLGNARLLACRRSRDELRHYEARICVRPRLAPPTEAERRLRDCLRQYAVAAIRSLCCLLPSSAHLLRSLLDNGGVESVSYVSVLDSLYESGAGTQCDCLLGNLYLVGQLYCTTGIAMVEQLQRLWEQLLRGDPKHSMQQVSQYAPELSVACRAAHNGVEASLLELSLAAGPGAMLRALVEDVSASLASSTTSLSLVLVRERAAAHYVAEVLAASDRLSGAACEPLIGHGMAAKRRNIREAVGIAVQRGPVAGGMSVAQQRRLLQRVAARQCRVLVATDIACEGVDIQQCELLALVAPPTGTAALVQARGRVRAADGVCCVYCADTAGLQQLEELLAREEHMLQAVEMRLGAEAAEE